jgi:hypothetical protein
MKVGTTVMMNSSIASSSRKDVMMSPPLRQPFEIAIGPSHVAIRARREIHDDFSAHRVHHEGSPSANCGVGVTRAYAAA